MRPSALLREAVHNILTGTTRFLTFGLVFLALSGGLIYADHATAYRQIEQGNSFRDSGATVLTITAPDQISGKACLSLSKIPEVQAAGAMRESARSISISVLPQAPVPEYEVSSGFASLLGASDPVGAGLILSDQVAQPLGLKPGSNVETSSGRVKVADTYNYPSDGRRPGFGYAALVVANDQRPFDECWVEAWPQIENLGSLLFSALVPGSGEDGMNDANSRPSISQLNSSLGEAFTGNDQFLHRITRYGVPAMFLIGLSIGGISIRVRRLEFSSALHSCVSKSDLACLALIESSAWALPSAAVSTSVAVALSQRLVPSDGMPLLLAELGIPIAGFCGVTLGALLATALIRKKHLLRFFRER